MKQLYIYLLLAFCFANIYANNTSFALSGEISGPTAVCLNETNTFITFTGSGGTAPYTFTYTLNGGAVLTIATTGSNDSVTLPINTTAVTSFKYDLKSVKDKTSAVIAATGSATVTVNAPPTIDFTFTNNNTCSGTIIQFTSTITGAGNFTYSWDFGDSTATSNQKNPTHAFNALGCGTSTFKVVLNVNVGGCSVSKAYSIIVKQKPDINFTDVDHPFDPFSNCANASTNPVYPITVGNKSTSTCISSFSINWGDGTTENNISFPISHTYNFSGAYSMVITAIGTNGCVNTKTYIIKNISNPKGGLNSPGSTQNLCAPTANLQFSISNWGTNSLDTTYNIDYDDDSPIVVLTQNEMIASSYFNPTTPENSLNYPVPHIYTKSSCPASSFEVKLKVTNACSTTPFTLGNISILIKPDADFMAPPKACVNTSVLFTNTTIAGYGQSCAEAAIYTWDFGDGTPIIITPIQTQQNQNHTYALPGTYTVILTSQNLCGLSSISKTICIEPALTPLFTVNTKAGCTPLNVTTTNNTDLTNQCATPEYEWSVVYTADVCGANGVTIPIQTTADATYNFTESGTYLISLKASNSCTPAKIISEKIVVKKPPVVTSINTILPNYCGAASISPTATVNSCAETTSVLTYAWSFPGGTPATANTLNPGTINYPLAGDYKVSLIVSNECGDSNLATQDFKVSTAPIITNTSLEQTICSGSQTTLVTLTANPVGTTYSWTATATSGITGFITSGSTDNIPIQTIITTNPLAGKVIYSIIPSFGGCDGTPVNYVINVNPAPTIITQPQPSSVCINGVANILKVALSSSTVTPTYQWFSNTNNSIVGATAISGATTDSFNPPTTALGTLFYYCEITLASGGCTSIISDIVSIIVNPKPTITSQPVATQNLCVGATIPSPLTVSYSGGTGTPSYQWFSNTNNANTGGTLITNATNVDYLPPVYTGAGSYFYYVEVKFSSSDCGLVTSNVAEVIVIDKPVITTQPIVTQTVCQNSVAVNLEVVVTGGIGNVYNYQWYSSIVNNTSSGTQIFGATNSTFTPPTVTAGTTYYYCVISQTNGIGCNVTSTIAEVVIQISPVIDDQPVSSTVCVNQVPALLSFTYSNGSGTPTYQWFSNIINSNIGGALISGAINATYLPSTVSSGTIYYYCEVTFSALSGGCAIINTSPAEVIVNDNPIVANESDTICSTNSFTISPINSGSNVVPIGTTYTWATPIISPAGTITGATEQLIPQTEISQTLINTTNNVAKVTYTVTPLSGVCLGNSFQVVVTVNPAINANVVVNNNTCFGVNNASISTNVTGGIPFSTAAPYLISWIGPNGFTSSATSISNLAPGQYDLNITDAGGCPFSDSYQITEPDDIIVTVESENNISCFGNNDGSISLSVIGGTGNFTFTWKKNGNPFASTEDIANLGPGNYEVAVTDVNNCGPKTLSFTIVEPPLLVVSLLSQTDVLCYGKATGAIVVNVIGGTLDYNFNWTGPNNFTSSAQNLTDIFAGTYDLIVTDANGCSKKLAVKISQSTEIIISYTTTTIKCYGDNNASISATISGGNAPYQFVWSNLSTSLDQTNLSAGDYTITVTDKFGCEKIETIIIPEAPVFKVDPIVKNISCFGANNGSINLNLIGGIAPVKLVWSDGSTAGTTRNNLAPGTYTATISDGTPCYITKTFTIVEPQLLVLSGLVTNALDCNIPNSGAINLIVAGGTEPYTYNWSNGSTTEDLNNITSGSYLVTVTDFNGCQKTAQNTITRPPPIAINVNTKTDFDCDTHTVSQYFVADVSGGVPPFQLNWSSGTVSGANNEIMHTDQNGIVILTVTDSKGCVQTSTVAVDKPVLGFASFETSSSAFTTYGFYSIEDPIYFKSDISGDYISVSWNFGDGTFSTEVNPVHTYVNAEEYVITQTVTYPFGCVYVYTLTLDVEKGYLLVIPTGFTPNNDGINDSYKPVTSALKNVSLNIYDTWGALIYSETGDDLRGWNGTINGKNAENGNYYGQISAETFYGLTVKQSTPFTLIK